MPTRLDEIKNACAYIDAGDSRGTGYLVSSDIVVTCDHVISQFDDGVIEVRLGDIRKEAKIITRDEPADCAILQLKTPVEGVEPMRLATDDCRRGDTWDAYGFPAIAKEAGHFLSGDVQDPLGRDPADVDAVVLYSREIAAAEGATPQGFSGTPVLVGGYVVGHLKRIIPNIPSDKTPPRAMMGTLYACPSRVIAKLLPPSVRREVLRPQPPQAGYDPDWYVERSEAESIAKSYLEFPGAPVVLWGPYRSGKTTTLKHLLEYVRTDEKTTSTIVRVNLAFFDGKSKLSLDALLEEMATVVLQDLGGDVDIVSRTWAGFGSPTNKLTRLMELHVLPRVEKRLVLAIDRADEIWRRDFRYDFFSLLRGWADNAERPIWSRLRLVLAISSSPLFLIDDPRRSPFNLTDPIELSDLGDTQIRALARKYDLSWNNTDLEAVKAQVGGQPYLLRVLMFRAGVTKTPLHELLEPQNLSRVFAAYFDQYRAWLADKPELGQELRRFKEGLKLPAEKGEACHTLVRAGLLNEVDIDLYHLRYGVYKHLFT